LNAVKSDKNEISPLKKHIPSKTSLKENVQSNSDMLIMMRQRLIKNLTARDENKSNKNYWESGAKLYANPQTERVERGQKSKSENPGFMKSTESKNN